MSLTHDIKLAKEVKLKNISEIAKKAGIPAKSLKFYGDYVAKVSADLFKDSLKNRDDGKMIVFTSITPTHLGEGKTVNTIGLGMTLNRLGKKAISCIRQPSLGPMFGIKGGGSGGGQSQVLPALDINLHLTGDSYKVESAQNLCAAVLDNSFFWGNPHKLDKDYITWKRVLDVSDRALRNITIGGGGKLHGVNRKTGIDITAASECMAILSLATDFKDLVSRLESIVVGYTSSGTPITAGQLKVAGAMAVILKDAFNPNLVQTMEHTPCFVHTGTFASLSHGSSSVIADKIALKLADYVVTETGFGADLGAEKFFDIKCRESGIKPDVVVVNVSVRALKVHSGDFVFKGLTMPEALKREDLSAVDRGCSNLEKQVENLKTFGVPIVVSINKFERDTKKEIDIVKRRAKALLVDGIALSDIYTEGSKGGIELAKMVMSAAKIKSKFRYLYPLDMNIKNKIERIAKSMYGASNIKYADEVEKEISIIEKASLDKIPVCMAKTPLSLSNNPKKKGRPRGFTLNITEVRADVGAGYILVKTDGINSMPAMPKQPRVAGMSVDIKTGDIKGVL